MKEGNSIKINDIKDGRKKNRSSSSFNDLMQITKKMQSCNGILIESIFGRDQ
jgi:hypothetical protein